jgi:hypothetical protein
MKIPAITGIIDRRILINYRIDPLVLKRVLPAPFRPQLVNGMGIAGICLIRLSALRPKWLPYLPGWASENAAHRIAVEWEREGELFRGVYIPRRDSSSRMTVWVGGRLFPGVHHHATFHVKDRQHSIDLSVESDDKQVQLAVVARMADDLPADSLFTSLKQASDFFEAGSIGYSATRDEGQFDGLELRTREWQVVPLQVQSLHSSFFDDTNRFPAGSAQLDCALLMRGIRHEWHSQPQLCGSTDRRSEQSLEPQPAQAR